MYTKGVVPKELYIEILFATKVYEMLLKKLKNKPIKKLKKIVIKIKVLIFFILVNKKIR